MRRQFFNLQNMRSMAGKFGTCSARVIRGGSWDDVPRSADGNRWLRSTTRLYMGADLRKNVLGFRVGRTLTP